MELIGCKQTGVPGQEIHYLCPCVQASSHMSRHVPPTSLQFSFLHFCFRFQYHWDSFRYPARPRIYTLFQMGDSSPSSPILLCPCLCSFSRFFLYIFFEIYINFHSFLSFFLLLEFDSLNFSFSFSPPLLLFFIFRRFVHTYRHTHIPWTVNLLFCFRSSRTSLVVSTLLCPPFTFDRS